ncbi:hypothetical protein A5M85_14965 [Cellulophaga lytica]|uniref:hypothetical protein n=1 Tax=Cellulophaga lytica TaxID=979 RepID=UPI000950A707|nr:hypothetical protein [Cellulophaga lytica]APU11539.1 hypothetical protein A5M85_14965 [Cellulophaga lytica]
MEKYKLGIIDETEKDRIKSIAHFEDNNVYNFECVELSLEVDSEDEIIEQIIEQKLDCVAIDYKLIDHPRLSFNGNIVLNKLLSEKYKFPAFILTNLVPDASQENIDDFRIISKRAINPESQEGEELINKLKNYTDKYYKRIKESEDELYDLIEKERSQEINDVERDRMIELDDFLEHSLSSKSKIPSGWKKPSGFEDISKMTKLAEEILNEIKSENE